jgi:hypothetical protein
VLLDCLHRARDAERGVVPVQVADRERLIDLELGRRGELAVTHRAPQPPSSASPSGVQTRNASADFMITKEKRAYGRVVH